MISKKREIVVDTETTGLSFKDGDRVIEIGCVELIDNIASGRNLQIYLNPETKSVSEDAIKVHNLDNNFLKQQPKFRDKAEEFLNFIKNDTLVIHNAQFDVGFINNELEICDRPKIKNEIVDTLFLARKKFGSGAASLDALCKKFNIAKEKREVHGALLDSMLLSEVYIELLGGRQRGFNFTQEQSALKEKKQRNAIKTKIAL